jgi:hypothetical protein
MHNHFEPLPIALRALAVPTATPQEAATERKARKPKRRSTRGARRVLVIDTETTTDPSQTLNFGVWRTYIDDHDQPAATSCVSEGIFYADDLPTRDPEGFGLLEAYAALRNADTFPGRSRQLGFMSRTQFVEQLLWRFAYKRDAAIVGFNLPFDLSRLALSAAEGRSRSAGAFSLRFWEYKGGENRYRPRITIKSIDTRRHLISFSTPAGDEGPYRGEFIDLRTLSSALSGRGHTLEGACDHFGVGYQKRPAVHGTISNNYIDYCREDVAATAALCRATLLEFARHQIDLTPGKAFSAATIGKAYERAMGIRPVLERQPDFSPEVMGWAMAAFYGGRAECRIRRLPVPVVYCDFVSMYPTCNALMGTWSLVTAKRIDTADATDDVRQLLAAPDLVDRCYNPATWKRFVCLVEVEPDGEVFPVRAMYIKEPTQQDAREKRSDDFGIGVNPYRTDSAWYSLGDVVASTILTGRPPKIRRAIRLIPHGTQRGLRPVKLRGAVEVDPTRDDFFITGRRQAAVATRSA